VIVYLDTETTGILAPIASGYDAAQEPRIVSLAVVTASGEVVGYQRVSPGCAIPPAATAVHGIRDESVASAPTLAEVWPRLLAKVGDGATVVAHSAAYDRAVLACDLRRLGLPLPAWRWGCTLRAARAAWPTLPRHTLASLAATHGLDAGRAHGALSDARTASQLGSVIAQASPAWVDDADPWHPLPADGAQVVAVTGHRHITAPDAETVTAAVDEHPAQSWVFGGASGVDTVALRAVRASHGIAWLKVIVPGTVAQQPAEARATIEACADKVVELGGDLAKPASYHARNRAMVREALEVLAFMDGGKGGSGTRNCAERAREQGRALRVVGIEGSDWRKGAKR